MPDHTLTDPEIQTAPPEEPIVEIAYGMYLYTVHPPAPKPDWNGSSLMTIYTTRDGRDNRYFVYRSDLLTPPGSVITPDDMSFIRSEVFWS